MSTGLAYRSRLTTWVYPHVLPDVARSATSLSIW